MSHSNEKSTGRPVKRITPVLVTASDDTSNKDTTPSSTFPGASPASVTEGPKQAVSSDSKFHKPFVQVEQPDKSMAVLPYWVAHEPGAAICSVDIHTEGARIVTCGTGTYMDLWPREGIYPYRLVSIQV